MHHPGEVSAYTVYKDQIISTIVDFLSSNANLKKVYKDQIISTIVDLRVYMFSVF